MPTSIDVTLPSDVKPVFPDKCIVCFRNPDSTTKILQNSQNWYSVVMFPLMYLFGWSRVEIPICRSCKWRFKLQRWSRELICWTLVFVAYWFLRPYFQGWPATVQQIALFALALVAVTPYVLGEVFWPRIFDTMANSTTVDYEFASLEYAIDFYVLNRDNVVKTDLNEAALRTFQLYPSFDEAGNVILPGKHADSDQ